MSTNQPSSHLPPDSRGHESVQRMSKSSDPQALDSSSLDSSSLDSSSLDSSSLDSSSLDSDPIDHSREVQIKILRDSLPDAKTLDESLNADLGLEDWDLMDQQERDNVQKAVRFLNDIRDVKNGAVLGDREGAGNLEESNEGEVGDLGQPEQPELPTLIGRFKTLRLLGQGGFAKVFLGHDQALDRLVAIKVPKPHALMSNESHRRFQREAHAAAMLSHPAIVPVFENCTSGVITFMVSAYCEGPTLAQWLDEHSEQITPRVSARIVNRLAEAVEHAHQRGVIHRDLKPGNILVESELGHYGLSPFNDPRDPMMPLDISCRVRITDFGLAKCLHDQPYLSLTAEGAVVGTPAYMSPEQARGEKSVGEAADIYSLGTILYELLTGVIPFKRNSNVATLRAIEDETPIPPRELNSAIPKDLEAICLRCLEKDPARRYSSAHALHHDLCKWMEGRTVVARRPSRIDRVVAWYARNPALAAALVFAFTSLVVGLAFSLWHRTDSQNNLRLSNLQRQRAERNVAELEGTIDEVLDEHLKRLDADNQLSDWQLSILSKILESHKRLIDQEAEQLDVSSETLDAYARFAHIYLRTGNHQKARDVCEQARQLWTIVGNKNRQRALQPILVDLYLEDALIELDLGNYAKAKDWLQQAFARLGSCQNDATDSTPNSGDREPSSFLGRSFVLNRTMGLVLAAELNNSQAGVYFDEAFSCCQKLLQHSPESAERKLDYVLILQDLGENASQTGNNAQAAQFFETALDEIKTLESTEGDIQYRRCCLLTDLALANETRNQPESSETQYQSAVTQLDDLLANEPSDQLISNQLSKTLLQQGNFFHKGGRTQAAEKVFWRGLKLADQMTRGRPAARAQVDFRFAMGKLLSRANDELIGAEISDDAWMAADQWFEDAIDVGEKWISHYPDDLPLRQTLIDTYQRSSQLNQQLQRTDVAFSRSLRASQHANRVLMRHAQHRAIGRKAVMCTTAATRMAVEVGEIEMAIRSIKELAGWAPESSDIQYQSGRLLAMIPQLLTKQNLVSKDKLSQIQTAVHSQALEHLRMAVDLGFDQPELLTLHAQWDGLRQSAEFRQLVSKLDN